MSRDRDDIPLALGPLIAWRAWGLFVTGRRVRLGPVCGYERPWPPMRPLRATCLRRGRHPAPDPACTCGLYGMRGPELLRHTRSPAVFGTVALWGIVVEHTLGFRAALGYPQTFRLVCPICFSQRGTDDPREPEIVAMLRHGGALPLCGEHRDTAAGIGLRIRAELSADGIHAALVDTYGVDELDLPVAAATARAT